MYTSATPIRGISGIDPKVRWVASLAGGTSTMNSASRWPSDLSDQEFFSLLDRHRITSAVWHTMQQLPALDVPPSIAQQLAARHVATVPRALQAAADLVRINRLLRDANVEYLTLKGPPLAIQYYGGLEHRHSKDLDLWIAPDQIRTAIAAFQHDGYRCSALDRVAPYQTKHAIALSHHLTFEKPGAVPVELHTQLVPFARLCQIAFADAYATATLVPIAGQQIPTLRPSYLFTYLCVHGAIHEWERLKWLADLPRMLSTLGWTWDDIQHDVQHNTHSVGSSRSIDLASCLCAQVFDRPLSSRKPNQRLATFVVNNALVQIQHPEVRVLAPFSLAGSITRWRYCAALSRSAYHKLAVLHHILAPTVDDLTTARLPNALYALYFFVRPASWAWRRLVKRSRAIPPYGDESPA